MYRIEMSEQRDHLLNSFSAGFLTEWEREIIMHDKGYKYIIAYYIGT